MESRVGSVFAVLVVASLGMWMPGCSSDGSSGTNCDVAGTGTVSIINASTMTTYTVELDGAVIGSVPDGERITRVLAAGTHVVRFLNPGGSEACTNTVTLAVCQNTNTSCNTDPIPCEEQQYGEWTFVNASGSVNYEVEIDGSLVAPVFAGEQSNPVQLSPGVHVVVFRNALTDQVSCQENIDVEVCETGQSSCSAP